MNYDRELVKKESCWLDVKALARVEATSEDSRYPINSAFEEDGHGLRESKRNSFQDQKSFAFIFHRRARYGGGRSFELTNE